MKSSARKLKNNNMERKIVNRSPLKKVRDLDLSQAPIGQ